MSQDYTDLKKNYIWDTNIFEQQLVENSGETLFYS
jgi:hypothetical protein